MSRIVDRVLVGGYLLVAIAPAIAIYTHFDHYVVYGALPRVEPPALAAGAVWDESFQKQLTGWFESHIGFSGYSIFVDNTVLYHVFGETKPDAHVKLGRDHVLYEMDDLVYYSLAGAELPTPATADAFADKVARLQAWLAARGRGFIPVIVPSKTSIYRAEIPDAWTKPVGSPPPTDEHLYRMLVHALDAHGVRYVDARHLLGTSTEDRRRLWGLDARHWSAYAACLVMREVMVRHAALTQHPAAPYPCDVTMQPADKLHVDHDLSLLTNAWGVTRAPTVAVVAPGPPLLPGTARPTTLIIGSSFSWTLVSDAERSGAFGPLHINFYNQRITSWPDQVSTPVDPTSAAWRDLTLTPDLYILDLTETYALGPGTYSLSFVDQLAAALLP